MNNRLQPKGPIQIQWSIKSVSDPRWDCSGVNEGYMHTFGEARLRSIIDDLRMGTVDEDGKVHEGLGPLPADIDVSWGRVEE